LDLEQNVHFLRQILLFWAGVSHPLFRKLFNLDAFTSLSVEQQHEVMTWMYAGLKGHDMRQVKLRVKLRFVARRIVKRGVGKDSSNLVDILFYQHACIKLSGIIGLKYGTRYSSLCNRD
jgi:hypothetical protein